MVIKKENLFKYIIILLSVIAFVGFVISPVTADIKVFSGSANQASFISSNILIGSYKAWELKGTFSRAFMYLIYKIAVIFVPYGSYSFEIAIKIIYAIFMYGITACSIWLIFEKSRFTKFTYVMSVSAAFMSLHPACMMQVEMTSSFLILLAFALYLNAIKTQKYYFLKLFTSGILIGSTFYFKSVFILMSVSVVAAIAIWCIHNNHKLSFKRMMIVVAGSVFILILNLAVILVINPAEIQDMIDASSFQNTLLSSGISLSTIPYVINKFINKYISWAFHLPVVLLGVFAFAVNFIEDTIHKRWNLIFYHFVLWGMPFIFIALSNKYFVYHFISFVFPSLLEIYYLLHDRVKIKSTIFFIMYVTLASLYIITMSPFSNNTRSYIKADIESYKIRDNFISETNFDTDEVVLFLDDGVGAFYLPNRSYIKYFFPLPLQRLQDSDLECHIKSKEDVLAYTGKYISVYESWFFNGKNAEIKSKIEEEYKYIGSYVRYSPSKELFFVETGFKEFDVYERV